MSLDLILTEAKMGRAPLPLAVGNPRPLTAKEVGEDEGETPDKALKRIRNSHHQIARLLAQKVEIVDVARVTGYTPQRIGQLQADPTFLELMSHYETIEARQYEEFRADFAERLAALGMDTVETIHEKLIEDPETFTKKELITLLTAVSDRTGHGPSSTVKRDESFSVDVTVLDRIKSAPSAPNRIAESDHETLLRLAVSKTNTSAANESEPDAWIEGEGHCVRTSGPEGVDEPEDRDGSA